MNPAVEKTLQLLREHPEQWRFDDYTADHKGLGLSLWICGMPLDCATYGSGISFSIGLVDRFRIYFAARKARNVAAALRLSSPETKAQ